MSANDHTYCSHTSVTHRQSSTWDHNYNQVEKLVPAKSKKNRKNPVPDKEILNQSIAAAVDPAVKAMVRAVRGRASRKHSPSILMQKSCDDLCTTDLMAIVTEFKTIFPEIYFLISGLMCGETALNADEANIEATPRLAMIYAIVMQYRNCELSRLQRTLSMCLMDNVVDQKVGSQLNSSSKLLKIVIIQLTIQCSLFSNPYLKLVTCLNIISKVFNSCLI